MTKSVETNVLTYAGNGSTTDFAFTFPILDETHVEVEKVTDSSGAISVQTLTTHYTISGSGNTEDSTDYTSGTVEFVTAPASGETVVIKYDVPITQGVDLLENSTLAAETLEDSLDKAAMIDSMQQEQIDNALRINSAESSFNDTIIKGAPSAGYIIQVDSGGDDLEFVAAASASLVTLLDEDDMASDSATSGATQQSIKAYTSPYRVYDMMFSAGYTSAFVKQDVAVQAYDKVVMTRSGSITGDVGAIETAPTDAALIIDIEKNGTSVYTTKPQFAAGSTTYTAGTLKTDGTEDFVSGDVITFKVTQIGSTEAGEGLTFTVDCSLS